jgi:uncharacterized integral membrane protein
MLLVVFVMICEMPNEVKFPFRMCHRGLELLVMGIIVWRATTERIVQTRRGLGLFMEVSRIRRREMPSEVRRCREAMKRCSQNGE